MAPANRRSPLTLQAGGDAPSTAVPEPGERGDTPPFTADVRGFRALVRSRVFRWVQFAAHGRWEAWSDDLTDIGDFGWTPDKLRAEFDGFVAAYGGDSRPDIATDADARGPDRFRVDEGDGRWGVEQILADPDGDDEWYLTVTVDLRASDEASDVVAALGGLRQR